LNAILSSITAYLGPLFSVAVGWFLHELSDMLKIRREDRRAVGEVLAELLEIRHQWRSLPAYFAEVQRRLALPPEAATFIRTILGQTLSPMLSRSEERYNEAIDSIKGRLPILAFELRGKDALRQSLDHLRSLAASDPAAVGALHSVESALTQEALPLLEELLLKLTCIHGFGTWLRLRRRVRKKEELQNDVQKLLDSMLKAAGVALPLATPPSS
jgi:hypothetical protein